MAPSAIVMASTLWRTCVRPAGATPASTEACTVEAPVSMSGVKEAPGSKRERGGKNRNHLEPLSMLHSGGMTTARPTVLVTELEYRKAEARFLAAPGLDCLRAPEV